MTMPNYDYSAVYCPVCGMIAILNVNALGKPKFSEEMAGGICPYCDSKLVETEESYEDIAKLENPNWLRPTKSKEEILGHIFSRYVKDNPQFIPEAHERMLRMKARKNKATADSLKRAINNATPTLKCPKCGSTSISTQKQGFGVGKAAAGVAVAGPAGALAGGINANKVYNVCQNCGHKWEPGK